MTERTREWPLVVFTTALQCACGLALAAAVREWRGESAALLELAIFPVVAVGLIASLFHLGRPTSAWRALSNVHRSRLSREIIVTSAFALAALAYGVLTSGPVVAAVTAVIGIAAVWSSARIYALPAQPFWDSAWVPVSFVATTALIAALLAGYSAPLMIAAAVLLISDVWLLLRSAQVRSRFDTPGLPPPLLDRRQRASFVAHVVLSVVFPVLVAGSNVSGLAPVALVVVIVGALCGRTLMYSLPHKSEA